MRVLWLCALMFTVSVVVYASEPDVTPFINAIVSGDARECDRRNPSATSAPQWKVLKDVLQHTECNVVSSYRVRRDTPRLGGRRIELALGASGLTPRTHLEQRLSTVWFLQFVPEGGGWRLDDAIPIEREAARCIVADPVDAAERVLDQYPEADPGAVAIALADEASEPGAPESYRRLAFAVALAQRCGDRDAEATCLCYTAIAHIYRAEFPEAIVFAQQSIAVAREAGNADGIAAGYLVSGNAKLIGGDAAASHEYFEAGVAMIEQLRDPTIALKNLRMSEYAHEIRGDFREALLETRRLSELSRRYGWAEGELVAALATGDIHLELHNYEAASPYLFESFAIAGRMNDRRLEAMTLFSLALCDLGTNPHRDWKRALASLRRSVEIGTGYIEAAEVAFVRIQIGNALIELGRLAEADAELAQLLEIATKSQDPHLLKPVLLTRAQLRYAQHRYRDALQDALEVIRTSGPVEGVGSDWTQWVAPALAGRALVSLGRTGDALLYLRQAVSIIEARRAIIPVNELGKAAYFGDKLDAYVALADALVDRGRVREAFTVAERMKGRSLRDALEQGKVDLSPSLSHEEQEEEGRLNENIANLNVALTLSRNRTAQRKLEQRLEEARNALGVFESQIFVKHADAGKRRIGRVDDQIALPRTLRSGAFVEFSVGEKRTIAFTVSSGGDVAAVVIPITRKRLAAEVDAFVDSVASRDLNYAARASHLYDLLLGRLPQAVTSGALLCIVPDDSLWRLPFQALRRRDRFVVEDTAVFYVPSLAVARDVERLRRPQSSNSTLLAFGNPSIDTRTVAAVRSVERAGLARSLGRLPDAEHEVRSLERLYGAAASHVYVGRDAREATLKKESNNFRVLHFATHAIFDDRSPMYSALVLVPSDGDDGLLEAREIVNLKLNADLAVLSACDSGRGAIGSGEGVIGLSWALLVAGCPTTVVAQWQVSSASTTGLMLEFHKRLLRGESKALALRHAQLATLHSPAYHHPFYWAPFVAIGAAW